MSSNVEIRKAGVEDAEQIAEILFEAFSIYKAFYTPEAFTVVTPPADEIVRRFDDGPQWVAVRGEEALGTVSVLPEPEWLYIRSMAVRPSAQGLGIGNMLMDAVEGYGRENVFDRLFYTRRIFLQARSSFTRNTASFAGGTRQPTSGTERRAWRWKRNWGKCWERVNEEWSLFKVWRTGSLRRWC